MNDHLACVNQVHLFPEFNDLGLSFCRSNTQKRNSYQRFVYFQGDIDGSRTDAARDRIKRSLGLVVDGCPGHLGVHRYRGFIGKFAHGAGGVDGYGTIEIGAVSRGQVVVIGTCKGAVVYFLRLTDTGKACGRPVNINTDYRTA